MHILETIMNKGLTESIIFRFRFNQSNTNRRYPTTEESDNEDTILTVKVRAKNIIATRLETWENLRQAGI